MTIQRVIDAHHHVGMPDGLTESEDEGWRRVDIIERRAFLDSNHIDACLLFPGPSIAARDHRNETYARANSMLARYRDEAGEIVAGICCAINPVDTDGACREVDRCLGELGMNGLVFHHMFMGIRLDHPGMAAVLERAESYGASVFVHIMAGAILEEPWRLFRLADQFPNVRFVGVDAFSSAVQGEQMVHDAGAHPNVWFETGALASVGHGLDLFVRRHGISRVIFGSDCHGSRRMFATPYPLLELRSMELHSDDLALALGGNLVGLITPA